MQKKIESLLSSNEIPFLIFLILLQHVQVYGVLQ